MDEYTLPSGSYRFEQDINVLIPASFLSNEEVMNKIVVYSADEPPVDLSTLIP